MKQQSFPKKERLKRKKWIEELFSKGKSIQKGKIKCFYLPFPSLKNHQVLIAVPKRCIRKAVNRNKIKRRMREIYRKRDKKTMTSSVYLLLGWLYLGDDTHKASYAYIAQTMSAIMAELPLSNNVCCEGTSSS